MELRSQPFRKILPSQSQTRLLKLQRCARTNVPLEQVSVVMCQVLKKKFIVRLNLSDIKRMLKSVGWIFMLILACVSCMLILTCVSSMFILACVSLHAYLVARSALSVFSQCLVQWMPVSCSVLASALFSGDFAFPALWHVQMSETQIL